MTSWRNSIDWLRPKNPVRNQTQDDAQRDLLPKGIVSLRFRLIFIVTIALTPIAIVSVFQGIERARSGAINVHDRLTQSVQAAASSEENVIASSEQMLRTLAHLDDVRNVTSECDRTLSDVLIGVRFITNISRGDKTGKVVCSALPQSKGMLMNPALFNAAKSSMKFSVSGQVISSVTHGPIIVALLPLQDAHGAFNGAIAMGVNAKWLDYILKARNLPRGAVVSVFDRKGQIMATNNETVARTLFSTMPASQTLLGGLETRNDAKGEPWTFSAAPLSGNNIFVGFGMRESHLFGPTYLHVVADLLLPIAMIALAWGAIWFATERQITQWIAYLRRVAAAYRGGHYRLKPQLENAPAEFKLLGSAMENMAEGIQDRDKSLREAVAHKTHQIRETHHRVKNNLQVVMSLLSLQAAQSRDPTVKEALGRAQARINALALVHRLLNEVEDQTSVDLQRLLRELTRQVAEGVGAAGAGVAIEVDVVELNVPGEIAVPIALFTVEALANAFRHAFSEPSQASKIYVALQPKDDAFHLAVRDNGCGFSSEAIKSGIGDRLLKVFARQVQGTVTVSSTPGSGTIVDLIFPRPSDTAQKEFNLSSRLKEKHAS